MDNQKREQILKSRLIVVLQMMGFHLDASGREHKPPDKKVLSKLSKETLYGTTRNSKKYDQLNLFRELIIA